MCQPIEVHAAESGMSIQAYAITFGETRTMCLLVLRISNNANVVREVYPDDGIPGEVDPSEGEAQFETVSGDIVNSSSFASASKVEFKRGDISPDTQLIAAYWVETDVEWDQITRLFYTAGAPLDKNQMPVGDGYNFEIEISDWEYTPLPEELEPFFSEWSVQP